MADAGPQVLGPDLAGTLDRVERQIQRLRHVLTVSEPGAAERPGWLLPDAEPDRETQGRGD